MPQETEPLDPSERRSTADQSSHPIVWAPAPSNDERPTTILGDLVRGGMIGAVETVPGVSGGTVALVVGIYTRLIDSAAHVVSAMRRLMSGSQRGARAGAQLRKVDWKLIVPVFAGMAIALFTIAGPMADLVETYPELMRAAFFGMVLASISIPLRMAGLPGLTWRHILYAVLAAGVAFWLVSLPPTTLQPTPVILIVAAALAVAALLLPGLSGSFLLLTFGLYEPTLRAVDERDLSYLGIFAVGLLLGLVSIVKGLQWLLQHRRQVTLIILTGVMIGAMRTLWPWQSASRELTGPDENWPLALVLAVAGFAVVAVLSGVDAYLNRRQRMR